VKVIHPNRHRGKFLPLTATREAQLAIMNLPPGGESDEALSNEHPRCEQWMYVTSGRGRATVVTNDRRRSVDLQAGTLLVIEKQERHQIKNTGRRPLRALNFYLPPAYRSDGTLRPTATRTRKRG
jgi:mannose-6-phosphate isomerase-like protein (cupin superfamily)